ncbi:MAG: hypothetical protein HC878_10270 [Leptolyngbyaceae cyanobacterium SL_5_14]|nr:hypothetical protein [Leptolyngbyaceae cyanobacterium SL_5_14]
MLTQAKTSAIPVLGSQTKAWEPEESDRLANEDLSRTPLKRIKMIA